MFIVSGRAMIFSDNATQMKRSAGDIEMNINADRHREAIIATFRSQFIGSICSPPMERHAEYK